MLVKDTVSRLGSWVSPFGWPESEVTIFLWLRSQHHVSLAFPGKTLSHTSKTLSQHFCYSLYYAIGYFLTLNMTYVACLSSSHLLRSQKPYLTTLFSQAHRRQKVVSRLHFYNNQNSGVDCWSTTTKPYLLQLPCKTNKSWWYSTFHL